MQYFIPQIRVPATAKADPARTGVLARLLNSGKTNAPDQAARERLGGVPWGLPIHQWPKCRDCGKSQSLLAQLEHHPDRLDLGREGRVLFAFQCAHDPGMCATWEAFSGANACLIVEPEALGATPTRVPDDAPPIDPEVHIIDWIENDDRVVANVANAFFSEDTFIELTMEQLAGVTWSTRLGGLPRWMQSPDEAPKPGWRFAGQLDGTYSFLSPPIPCPSWVSVDQENFEGRTHLANGPNFGGGLAYVFLRHAGGLPEGCIFWQR